MDNLVTVPSTNVGTFILDIFRNVVNLAINVFGFLSERIPVPGLTNPDGTPVEISVFAIFGGVFIVAFLIYSIVKW